MIQSLIKYQSILYELPLKYGFYPYKFHARLQLFLPERVVFWFQLSFHTFEVIDTCGCEDEVSVEMEGSGKTPKEVTEKNIVKQKVPPILYNSDTVYLLLHFKLEIESLECRNLSKVEKSDEL